MSQMKKDEMDGMFSMHVINERHVYRILIGKRKWRDLENLGVYGKMLLKCNLKGLGVFLRWQWRLQTINFEA